MAYNSADPSKLCSLFSVHRQHPLNLAKNTIVPFTSMCLWPALEPSWLLCDVSKKFAWVWAHFFSSCNAILLLLKQSTSATILSTLFWSIESLSHDLFSFCSVFCTACVCFRKGCFSYLKNLMQFFLKSLILRLLMFNDWFELICLIKFLYLWKHFHLSLVPSSLVSIIIYICCSEWTTFKWILITCNTSINIWRVVGESHLLEGRQIKFKYDFLDNKTTIYEDVVWKDL